MTRCPAAPSFIRSRTHPTYLPLASTVKFTENGVKTDVGKGFWETAGKPMLRRTLIDTKKCVVASIAVTEEPFSSKTVGTSSSSGRSGFGGGGGGRIGGGASASEANPTGSGLVDCHMFRMRDGKVDLIMSIVGPSAVSMGWSLEPIE